MSTGRKRSLSGIQKEEEEGPACSSPAKRKKSYANIKKLAKQNLVGSVTVIVA